MQKSPQPTLCDCTVKSVRLNVIVCVCKINREVHAKRKVKENPVTNKARWWFVLHGNESLLCELEEKWPKVNLQTSWNYVTNQFTPSPLAPTAVPVIILV